MVLGPIWGSFWSFCLSKKIQKPKAIPNKIRLLRKQKLRKLTLHYNTRSSKAFAPSVSFLLFSPTWPPPESRLTVVVLRATRRHRCLCVGRHRPSPPFRRPPPHPFPLLRASPSLTFAPNRHHPYPPLEAPLAVLLATLPLATPRPLTYGCHCGRRDWLAGRDPARGRSLMGGTTGG